MSAISGPGRPAPRKRPKPGKVYAPGTPGTGAAPRTGAAPPRSRAATVPEDAAAVAWTPPEAVTLLAVVAAAFLAKDALLNAEWTASTPTGTTVVLRVLVLATFYAVQIALLVYLAARRGRSFAGAFGLRFAGGSVRGALAAGGEAVALLFVTRVAGTAYGALSSAAGFEPPLRWNGDLARVFGGDAWGLALTVALVVLVGPFVEELVFRGVLLGAMMPRMGLWPAVLGSSLVFAAYHFDAWMLTPSLMLGVALAWSAARRRTLWPAIVLHSLYNAVAVAAAFYAASLR